MAEGGGLLNRYRVKSSIGGSNPPLSAMYSFVFSILYSNLFAACAISVFGLNLRDQSPAKEEK